MLCTKLHNGWCRVVEQEKRITVRVPDSLHRKVKAKSALVGKSVSDVLREYLTQWVEEDTPKGGKPPHK